MASFVARGRSWRPFNVCEDCLGLWKPSRLPTVESARSISRIATNAASARRTLNACDYQSFRSLRTSTTTSGSQARIWSYSATPSSINEPPSLPTGHAQLSHRRLVAVSGPDAAKFLQGLLTNNVDPNKQTPFYSAFLDARGRVLWDVFIWTYPALVARNGNWACFIEVDAGETDALMKHLRRHKLRSKINMSIVPEEEMSIWAIWGDREKLADVDQGVASFADPRLHSSSLKLQRLLLNRDQGLQGVESLERGAQSADDSLASYHLLRYLYGIPEGPIEIPRESALPMEYNIDLSQGIDFKKGCYVGQELTIRTKHTGVVRKRILPVQLYPSNSTHEAASRFPMYKPDEIRWSTAEDGADIKQLDEEGKIKKGRATGKLVTTFGNVGLALCRLEMMTSMKVSAEGGTWRPGLQFGVQNERSGEVVKIRPFVKEAFQIRVRDIWDKNRTRI